jgi:5-methyltetrahydrofolate--homocysteine methyltransferase
MIVIGELVNCTRKRVGTAALNRDAEFIRQVARDQSNAGADLLDVNGGIPGQEAECLAWLVGVVQEAVQIPLCLDSSDPQALQRALPLCTKRPMINSITDEPARYEAVLPLLREFRPQVIALCMSSAGPPAGVEDRVATASRLVDRLTAQGMALEDIFVDPCVLPASTGPEHGKAILEAVGVIRTRYPGVHISAGVSNVSYGLPLRKLLNEVFLVLLLGRGLDAAIVDPCDQQLMMNLRAAEALLGRDEYCVQYLRAFREGKLELKAA